MARLIARALLMFVTAVAALYAVALLGGALLARFELPVGIASAAAFVVSLLLSRFVWTHSETPPEGLVTSIFMGAFVVGAIGFTIGFFGPLLVTPQANQGPLLGLFITGPAGFIIGGIGGLVFWSRRRRVNDRGIRL